jgi:hypothetical protein
MNNLNVIFEQYIKDLKLTTAEDYVYVVRDGYFGDIIFSVSSNALTLIKITTPISDKYINKMIAVDVIKEKTIGYELENGIYLSQEYIHLYNCHEKFKKARNALYGFICDIMNATSISKQNQANTDERFYNDVLLRKSDMGAGKYIMDDKIMYVAPCMLPGSKSTDIDIVSYYTQGNDYYVASFTTHKKTNDIITLMRFINI